MSGVGTLRRAGGVVTDQTPGPAALFTVSEVYDRDPLNPGMDNPTPVEVVAELPRAERVQRVETLIRQAHEIIRLALAEHLDGHELVARCVMFSGGNDSTTLAHLMRDYATHAVMANTTIGVEETRQYVRDTCAGWGLPLIEKLPPDSFDDLVLGRATVRTGPNAGIPAWQGGFPGPSAHWLVYQRLKERCFEAARNDLVSNPYQQRVLFIFGRRREESERREDIPMHERRGSIIYASPLTFWTKLDLTTYRTMHPGMPRNEVCDLLEMSGECLCGAFAHPGELDELRFWGDRFKGAVDHIESLQEQVRALGIPEPYCTWGHGVGGKPKSHPMCGNCARRFEEAV